MITVSHSSLSLHLPNSLHRLLTGVILFLVVQTHLRAQATEAVATADTLQINFRADSVNIDMRFESNSKRWATFEERFHRDFDGLNTDKLRLDIYAGASPEGPASRNEWLGRNRGAAIRRLVRRRLGNKVGNIVVHNEGPRWAAFRKSVEASSEPWRDEVLSIIDMRTNDDPNSLDTREKLLRKLDNGKVWPVLLNDHLAPLRSGASAILTWEDKPVRDTAVVAPPPVIPETVVMPLTPVIREAAMIHKPPVVAPPPAIKETAVVVPPPPVIRETVVVRDTVVVPAPPVHRDTVVVMMKSEPPRRDTLVIRDTVVVMMMPGAGGYTHAYDSLGIAAIPPPDSLPTPPKVMKPVMRRPAWILRTNLPLWGILTPNLQAEWSLDHSDLWSLNLEFIGPWWVFGRNAYANELVYGSAELRYWLGRRSRHHTLDGFHVGLSAGGGYYDFEWKSKGYQGEAFMAFVNLGWQHRFGKRHEWAFDAGLGLGYLYSPYRRYYGSSIFPATHTERYDDHLMWQYTSRLNWFGMPHANISIGYVFMPRKGLYRRVKATEREVARTAIEQQRDAVKERERQQLDSLHLKWYNMPKAERKAARKAYKQEQKKLKKQQKKK